MPKTATDEPKKTKTPKIDANLTVADIVKPTIEEEHDMREQSALTKREATLSIVGGISTAELQQALDQQTEQRKIIRSFVKDHLEDGTDFGRIHVMSKDKCPDQYNCKKDYHYSKPVLFKPGQEKLFSLFQITSKLERDEETYAMLPGTTGLVAYKCIMYRNGNPVGEGRGSATVGDNRRDTNATIKIAEKRARMDACLSLGFSEYFAQDLDDPDYKSAAEMANQRAAAEAERRDTDEFGLMPRDPALAIDNPERATLHRLILKAGFSDPDEILELLKTNGITDPHAMTSGQARDMMGKLAHSLFSAPVMPLAPPTVEEPEPPSPPQEEELVIDDDLKSHVHEQYANIGLNARGKMWFMKAVAGRPFGDFDKLSDDAWRKAYDFVEGILDGIVDVDEAYIAGLVDERVSPVNFSEPTTILDS